MIIYLILTHKKLYHSIIIYLHYGSLSPCSSVQNDIDKKIVFRNNYDRNKAINEG